MQSVSSRIWTCVAVFISYDDNNYNTGTSNYTTGTFFVDYERRRYNENWVTFIKQRILLKVQKTLLTSGLTWYVDYCTVFSSCFAEVQHKMQWIVSSTIGETQWKTFAADWRFIGQFRSARGKWVILLNSKPISLFIIMIKVSKTYKFLSNYDYVIL